MATESGRFEFAVFGEVGESSVRAELSGAMDCLFERVSWALLLGVD